jgi:preprotein translocase subunit SecY
MKNIITHLLAAVGSFGIAVGLMQGFIQQFISFEDPINEMAMCVLTLMLGTVFTGIAVSEIKEKLS